MTLLAETGAFAEKLRNGMQQFRRDEKYLRTQYVTIENAAPDSMPAVMLERPTRRFLIDHFLRALDWDPDNPAQVIEEARAHTVTNDRLYFDYLGVSPSCRAPVLIVEAKGFDIPKPRRARGAELGAKEMGQLICDAVSALKDVSQSSSGIVAEWAEYLNDLHSYVSALNEFGRRTLRRVVITAGNWIIIFEEPIACFVTAGQPIADHVHCFPNGDEILLRHVELYEMLHRRRLVDTLPLVLDVPEALEFLPRNKIEDCYRAVMVATTTGTGAERKKYPTRSVYPAVLVKSSNRWFAIVNLDRCTEEPKGSDRIEDFLKILERAGSDLERRLRTSFDLALVPRSLDQFPGFPVEQTRQRTTSEVLPLLGSTSDRAASEASRTFVIHSGEPGAPAEFVVVTGESWFYKSDRASTADVCAFHYFKEARKAGVARGEMQFGCSVASFTEDGQDRHCSHGDLQSIRAQRCHIRPLETHLCCQSCTFVGVCWDSDRARLPCPT